MPPSTLGRKRSSRRRKVKPLLRIRLNASAFSSALDTLSRVPSLTPSQSSKYWTLSSYFRAISRRASNGTTYSILILEESPPHIARTDEELDQEHNVRYVIETRAKQSLTLMNMEDYRG
jgi:hypothetical protein